MLAAAQGDREAFGILVERHHCAIVQFVHRFLGIAGREAAEDLAQDVFLAAWKAAPSFRPQAKVLTWLLRITTNVCLNYRRSSRLRVAVSLGAEGAGETSGPDVDRPDARAIDRERAETVRRAVAGLPAGQRAAILLRHFLELSYVEIADVLGTSVSAVESLLFRARLTLRKTANSSESDAPTQVSPALGVE